MRVTTGWAVTLLAAIGATAAASDAPAELPEPHPDLPGEFRQFLPRGDIPAVFDPQFVSAAEAAIADDAWVLGVESNGTARAYSLNLLNRHEVVNDRIGDRDIAAVW